MGEEGGIKISMHGGRGEKGEGYTTQRRQVVILQHFAMLMDSDCKGVYRGTWYRGEPSKHNILHVSVE